MKTVVDVTCRRCGNTTSVIGADAQGVIDFHRCVDGSKSTLFEVTQRTIPGPGERLSDKENAS